MGAIHLKMLKLLVLLTLTEICAAQPDMTLSVYTVTSKSMTGLWSRYTGASSYRLTATPNNSPGSSVFVQFSGNTVMGTVNSLSPNTLYTLRVEAMDNDFNVLSSAAAEHLTAPAVPAIEQAYSKRSNSITVEFTEVSGAISYILRAESETGDFFSETMVDSSPGTVLQLQPYTTYSLSVMTVNVGGRSQPSYTIQAKTVVVAPELKTESPSNHTINVTWLPVQHAVAYTVYISQYPTASPSTEQPRTENTTNFVIIFDDLEPGTLYYIKVTAWDPEGHPGDVANISQTTRPAMTHPMPEVIPGRGPPGVTVHWDLVQGAEGYIMLSSNGKNCSSINTPYCIISPLECGQNLSVIGIAYNQAGPSYPSTPEGYITPPCPPVFEVKEDEIGRCSVEWIEMQLVDFYMAYIKRDDGVEEHCNTTGTTCYFDCMCGYTYLTTVFAYNRAGPSPLGYVLNYTTIPCCPENVSIELVSTETLEITWSLVRGAELYETTAAQPDDDVIHCNDTAPVCALSDLRCNTVYSVVVTPCCEAVGCNRTCKPHTRQTAPCSPEILNMTQTTTSTVRVLFTNPNTPNTTYTITSTGRTDTHTCQTQDNSCELTQVPCGTTYEVVAVATTAVGQSLPSFSVPLETGPCCPTSLNVTQVTQAMTNVTWSPGHGARSYITALTSPRGHAKCHTMDTHCLMGCITCGTNYSVSLDAISSTGHKSQCNYYGFSSNACCPTSVKVYRLLNNTLRVYWRSSGLPPTQNHRVDLYGSQSNYTCTTTAASSSCDVHEVTCGDVYSMVVAPVQEDGGIASFCARRVYSVSCSGSNVGVVIYRGKRSVD